MAEWLLDEGVGEHRAALLDGGEIIEAAIDRLDGRLRVGAVVACRLGEKVGGGAWVAMSAGDAIVEAVPAGVSQGGELLVEVVREAIPEPGRAKPARVRATDRPERAAPRLADRLTGFPVRRLGGHEGERLERAGWSALVEEAASGEIDFPGGALRLSPTPAMALFDVDGAGPPGELAVAGARAAAAAIRRLAIGGSIGIDLPTAPAQARRAAADAIDATLPPPFERTAVNGFGFVQIVRPRPRASIPELVRADPVLTAALELLRRGGTGHGPRRLVAAPAVIARIAARAEWTEELAARAGGAVALRPDPGTAISTAYVELLGQIPPA
ncbi:ribonuclease [Sphingomonas sp.]|uniref:ribonuclease n=1 Tax=Sphingomonas sp. TaxID=28214 RepID=UPI003B004DB7